MPRCPVCKVDSVKKQFTWSGVLYGVLCFPCGMYCCLKTNRDLYCPLCGYQVVYSNGEAPLMGKRFRLYSSMRVKPRNTNAQPTVDTTVSTAVTSTDSTPPVAL